MCPTQPQKESSLGGYSTQALGGSWGGLCGGPRAGGGGLSGARWPRWWARGVHSAVSCLLYFSCFSPPPLPALLLPRVWPRAVPTYGPYGRFCSRSARLSCTPVLVTVTPACLSPWLLCVPVSFPTDTPGRQSISPGLLLSWNPPCLVLGHGIHSRETRGVQHVPWQRAQRRREQASLSLKTRVQVGFILTAQFCGLGPWGWFIREGVKISISGQAAPALPERGLLCGSSPLQLS